MESLQRRIRKYMRPPCLDDDPIQYAGDVFSEDLDIFQEEWSPQARAAALAARRAQEVRRAEWTAAAPQANAAEEATKRAAETFEVAEKTNRLEDWIKTARCQRRGRQGTCQGPSRGIPCPHGPAPERSGRGR